MYRMNVFELDVTMDGNRLTYYDLGCMYDMWFEILRDFTDYRDYMGLSSMVWLCKWSLLGLISYNLGGSVTEEFLDDWEVVPYDLNKKPKEDPDARALVPANTERQPEAIPLR